MLEVVDVVPPPVWDEAGAGVVLVLVEVDDVVGGGVVVPVLVVGEVAGVVAWPVLVGGVGVVGVDVVGVVGTVGVVVVPVPVDVVPVPSDPVDVVLDADGGFVSRPLLCSALSISCCTTATSEATAAGVPPAPSAGNAFSCFRSWVSVAINAAEGWALSVTTIWSARAVVVQAGQS